MIIKSDHNPLEMIFKKEFSSAPMRLQRMTLRLQNYAIEVQYKKGKLMYPADTLSHAYWQQEHQMSVKCLKNVEQQAALAQTPDRLKRLQKAMKLDDSLKILQEIIVNGCPKKSMVDERLLPYYGLRSELVVDDDFIFKGH